MIGGFLIGAFYLVECLPTRISQTVLFCWKLTKQIPALLFECVTIPWNNSPNLLSSSGWLVG